jgi:hypothetical protein
MRKYLRVAALLVLLGVTGFWAIRGHHVGWTHNSETHFVTDPVTGIEGPVVEQKYTPGVDLLVEGFVAAIVLGGVSFAFRKQA